MQITFLPSFWPRAALNLVNTNKQSFFKDSRIIINYYYNYRNNFSPGVTFIYLLLLLGLKKKIAQVNDLFVSNPKF